MSAFFAWDTEKVKQAILAELEKQGRSIHPDAYEPGADEWGDIVRIDIPELKTREYFTPEWDVNIWDDDGRFTITAYPIYDGVTDCSSWVTCKGVYLIDPDQREDEDQFQEER
jgi:hypothetical protein